MDVRHLGATSWLVVRESFSKQSCALVGVLCRSGNMWCLEKGAVRVCGGWGVWRTRMPVYTWRLAGVFSDCRRLCCIWEQSIFGTHVIWDLNNQTFPTTQSLLCSCCFWSRLKVNGQVFGTDEQCVVGSSAASQRLLAVGTVTGLSSFRCRRCVLFLYSHTD